VFGSGSGFDLDEPDPLISYSNYIIAKHYQAWMIIPGFIVYSSLNPIEIDPVKCYSILRYAIGVSLK
jgi:hypothetical protein